jgi:hypothetical protein
VKIIIFSFIGSLLATSVAAIVAYDVFAPRGAIVLEAARKTLGPADLDHLLQQGREHGWYAPQ